MLFNKIYDKINHLILSVQNQNKWFRMWVTSNYVNCSRRNPKRSAKRAYHTWIPVWSVARAGTSCVKEEGRIRNSSSTRWTFFHFRSTSSRKDDLTDIDMVRSRETGNIVRPTSWRRSARRSSSRASMIDSYEMKHFVIEWLKMVETKTFVDDGMLLRMKITLTIWEYKNTSTIRTNGGFIQISKVLIICHWGTDLISSRHCLPCNDCNKKQKKNHTCLLIPTSTNNGRHKVHLLQGGIWQGSWWSSYNSESQEEGEPSIEWTCDPFLAVFGKTLRRRLSRIQFFLLPLDRLQLTAVYCNRRVVWRQHLKWPVFAMEKCAIIGYRWNWQSQNTIWLQVHNWTTKSRRKELCTWHCVCVVKPSTTPMTTWQPRSRPISTQSTWNSTLDMSMCLVPLSV